MTQPTLEQRAAAHAALGDPTRLALADQLVMSDRSPQELRQRLGIASNLLAHHLDVLEGASLIVRGRSSGDGRRRYVHLLPWARRFLMAAALDLHQPALFICTANSARSQLAAALWKSMVGVPAFSGGTFLASSVHPGALAAAHKAGLDLSQAKPMSFWKIKPRPSIVVTVCDQARELLVVEDHWWHWSVPDPVQDSRPAAFDHTVDELKSRIHALTEA